MEKNRQSTVVKVVLFSVMFAISGVITAGGCILYGQKPELLIRNVIMVLAGVSIIALSYFISEIKQLFIYENSGKFGRFLLVFLCSLAASILLTYLPVSGWPYLIIYVLLGLFSNAMTGLAAGCVCLFLSVSLTGASINTAFLYFFVGMVGIYVFSTLNDEFKVGMPIFISLCNMVLCLTANVILFENVRLSVAQFFIPSINVFVCLILLLIILKVFCSCVIYRYRDKYMEINDPECSLLVELKNSDKKEYYHAVHTAYLSEKIAKQLQLDEAAIKTCGYYHRIGRLRGENTWGNVEQICNEYGFPPNSRKILREYVDTGVRITSKETVVVLLADCIVSSILYLFQKDPKAEIDYGQLIDTVFKKKLETSELWQSEVSLRELQKMRNIFIEEKLYYDFLR